MAILTPKGARAPHQLKSRRNVRVSHDRRGCGTDDIENLKTPIGTIQAYAGASAPQGYLLCQGQAISKRKYAELYLAIGDLYSNAETAEGFFNVPDLRDRFAQGANGNLGEVIEAGLPNITASVRNGYVDYNLNPALRNPSGALADGEHLPKTNYPEIQPTNIGIYNYDVSLTFDASKGETKTDGTFKTSNEHHVYGASDTVQPPAVAINYIIKY